MDPYVLGDGVLVMTPFCSVLQCLCARPLASALCGSAPLSAVSSCRRLSAASLPASPACLPLPASPCARSISPAQCGLPVVAGLLNKRGNHKKGGSAQRARCLQAHSVHAPRAVTTARARVARATRITHAPRGWLLAGSSTGRDPQVPLIGRAARPRAVMTFIFFKQRGASKTAAIRLHTA